MVRPTRRTQRSVRLVLAATVIVLASSQIPTGARPGAQANNTSEWTKSVVPAPQCGQGERTESGLRGQTTSAERLSPPEAYNCNLELVGKFEGEGGRMDFTTLDHCGYLSAPGVVVVDVSDRRSPLVPMSLKTPAMLDPYETLEAHARRKLLAALEGGPEAPPAAFELYDVTDCRRPVLKGSLSVPGFRGHAGVCSRRSHVLRYLD